MSVEELKIFREKYNVSREALCDMLNITIDTLNNWEYRNKAIPKTKISNVKYVIDIYIKNISTTQLNEPSSEYQVKTERITEDNYKNKNGVPLYENDVTAHITTSYSDIPETPSFYVDYKPFNDCSFYINTFGDSMFPKYKNGEKLAVKQILNFDVVMWGETYLVITNENANNLRTIKDVHYHDDESKIILRASNPNFKGDTVIDKKDIISMFAVKGKISQNFI